MGAWAKDPVPGAAAGAHPGRRSNITPGTRNSALGTRTAPAAAPGTVFRPCAMGSCSVLLYYYALILYDYYYYHYYYYHCYHYFD